MAYVKCTKLGDIKGRQDYIMNEERQENIVLKFKESFDFPFMYTGLKGYHRA